MKPINRSNYLKENWITSTLFLLIIALSLLIRFYLFFIRSADFQFHINEWCNYIEKHKGITAFKDQFYDYAPLYVYYLFIITKLELNRIIFIKLLSCFFDFVIAFGIYKILRLKYRNHLIPPLAAFACLFTPSFILNSALWGQCDSIYAAFCVLSFYFIQKKRFFISVLLFSIAFGLKLQSIFFIPFLLHAFLTEDSKIFKWYYFLAIPLFFLLTIIPCLIAGRNLGSCLMIYIDQSKGYPALSLNAPSIYNFTNPIALDIATAGILLTVSFLAVFYYAIFKTIGNTKETGNHALIALITVLTIPYLLPKMHERYFYLADVFSIIFCFYYGRRYWVMIAIPAISALCYMPFLFGNRPIPLVYLSAGIGFTIYILILDLFLEIRNKFQIHKLPPNTSII